MYKANFDKKSIRYGIENSIHVTFIEYWYDKVLVMLGLMIHVIDLTRKQGKEIWVEYLLGMQR